MAYTLQQVQFREVFFSLHGHNTFFWTTSILLLICEVLVGFFLDFRSLLNRVIKVIPLWPNRDTIKTSREMLNILLLSSLQVEKKWVDIGSKHSEEFFLPTNIFKTFFCLVYT